MIDVWVALVWGEVPGRWCGHSARWDSGSQSSNWTPELPTLLEPPFFVCKWRLYLLSASPSCIAGRINVVTHAQIIGQGLAMAASAGLGFPFHIDSPEHRVLSFPHIQKETCRSSKALCLLVSSHAGQGKLTHVKQFPSWKSFRLIAATEQGSFQVILWSLNYLRTLCPQTWSYATYFLPRSWAIVFCLPLELFLAEGKVTWYHQFFLSLSRIYDVLRCSLSCPPKIEMFIKSSREVLFIF